MKRVAVLVVLVAAACGGGSGAPPGAPSATPSAVGGLTVEVTSFGPSGSNVEVDFQATNAGTAAARFYWPRFVLIAPDGSKHAAYRSPGSAAYQEVDPQGTYADGGVFQFPKFTPGKYTITYAGQALQTQHL